MYVVKDATDSINNKIQAGWVESNLGRSKNMEGYSEQNCGETSEFISLLSCFEN